MDRIRHLADLSVRRAAGFGLLATALVVLALHSMPFLAMHALAILLTLEVLTLYYLGNRVGRVPYPSRELWAMLDGPDGVGDKRVQRIINAIMRETFLAYARRLTGPAAAAWVVDVALRLSE